MDALRRKELRSIKVRSGTQIVCAKDFDRKVEELVSSKRATGKTLDENMFYLSKDANKYFAGRHSHLSSPKGNDSSLERSEKPYALRQSELKFPSSIPAYWSLE